MARAALLDRDDAHEDEAGVRDRGVGEHALDVVLHEAGEGTDDDRQDGDAREDSQEVPLQVHGDGRVEAEHRSEGGNLDSGGHEAGDRSRCTRVDVGGPRVEGRGTDLEQEADHDAEDADEDHPVHVGVLGDGRAERRDAQRVGEAEEERRPHQHEARGEGAEHKVLQRGLVGQLAAVARGRGHDVERQRHDFESHEEGHEVICGREDHHAAQREQGQREHLGTLVALALGEFLGGRVGAVGGLARERAVADGGSVSHDQDGHESDDDKDRLGGDRQRVLDVLSERGWRQEDGFPAQAEHDACAGRGEDRQADDHGAAHLRGGEGLDEDAEDRAAQHDEDRHEAQPVNLGGLEVSHG